MNIAILGSRGIPNNYGGFETCAEELSVRLVQGGDQVTVYCSKPYTLGSEKYFHGVRRVILPTIKHKSLDKLFYVVYSLIHVCFLNPKPQAVLMLGVSGSLFCFIPRLFGIKVAINVDGLEWQRKKWGKFASKYLKASEKAACITCNRVITDALYIQNYYRKKYHKETQFIPYGIKDMKVESTETLKKLGVEPGEYVLFVSRFEPENNPLLVRKAFEKVITTKKLVLLGSSPYANEYDQKVKKTTDPRIIIPGGIFGKGYLELQKHAYMYIQATEVGGIHPALIEAIGSGHCIVANDVPEHREVLKEAGAYYNGTIKGLTAKLQKLLDSPNLVEQHRELTKEHISEYSWAKITTQYRELFTEMTAKSKVASLGEVPVLE